MPLCHGICVCVWDGNPYPHPQQPGGVAPHHTRLSWHPHLPDDLVLLDEHIMRVWVLPNQWLQGQWKEGEQEKNSHTLCVALWGRGGGGRAVCTRCF